MFSAEADTCTMSFMTEQTSASPPWEGIDTLQEDGFLCHVKMQHKLDLPPDKAYDIISDPDNARMFRNIEECTHRKVLHDNGRGRLRVEVDHQSGWRFMWHKGKFITRLLVEQDDNAKVMAFRLREGGFMKNFEGFWRMEPYPGQPQATLAVLHQNVLPIVSAPGLNWVITKICTAQIEAMLEDVKKEVARLNAGALIPEDQKKKMAGKRTWADPKVQGFQLDLSSEEGSPRAASPANGSSPLEGAEAADASAAAQQEDWELLKAAEHNMISSPLEQEQGTDTAALPVAAS